MQMLQITICDLRRDAVAQLTDLYPVPGMNSWQTVIHAGLLNFSNSPRGIRNGYNFHNEVSGIDI